MLMIEKQGKRALEQMFEAFKCYQEIGDSSKAKTLLKYTILGSIISDDSLDYSSTNESKVFKSDPEIQACIAIRQAYDANEMNTILEKLNEIEKDSFITKILDDFLRIVRLNAIQNKILPYTTVSLAFLATELKISE